MLTLILVLLFVSPAHAQLCCGAVVTAPGSVTSDAPVESSSAQIAASVTIGGGAGIYQPNGNISAWDQTLWAGINPQSFATTFPGWSDYGTNGTAIWQQTTTTALQTYAGALSVAQAQTQEMEGENFTNIETALNSPNVLTVLQAVGEAELQQIQQTQYERQLLAALITVKVTEDAERVSDQAREGAHEQNALLSWIGSVL